MLQMYFSGSKIVSVLNVRKADLFCHLLQHNSGSKSSFPRLYKHNPAFMLHKRKTLLYFIQPSLFTLVSPSTARP